MENTKECLINNNPTNKNFNLKEYNVLCAELLGFVNTTPTDKDFNIFHSTNGIFINDKVINSIETNFNINFVMDWNWIMVIVNKITKLEFNVEICNDTCTIRHSLIKDYPIFESYSDKSRMVAVIDAIWEFLLWYKYNKS